MLQDIIHDDDISLDWFFKLSLISDTVNVSQVFPTLILPLVIYFLICNHFISAC